jgi:cell division protein FtsL
MTNKAYTFIVVPDTASECKRYTFSKSLFYLIGVTGTILLIAFIVFIHTMLGEYTAMATKTEQVETLKKISLSQKSTLDRYEEDVVQLSKNLAQVKQLNSRLMILTGLNPANGEHNLGLGGAEEAASKPKEAASKPKEQKSKDAGSKK